MKEQDGVKVAAYAAMQFVKIHPFADGNGRLSRIFMNMVLIQMGHQPIEFSDRRPYLQAVGEDEHKNNGEFTRHIRPIVAKFDNDLLIALDRIQKYWQNGAKAFYLKHR